MFIQTSSHNRPHPKSGPAPNSALDRPPDSNLKSEGESIFTRAQVSSGVKPGSASEESLPLDLLQVESAAVSESSEAASRSDSLLLIEPKKLFPLTKQQAAGIFLSELAVEGPGTLMALASLDSSAPRAASAVRGGVTAMAVARGVYHLGQPGLDNKLEGASSLALSVASGLTFVPGAGAALAGNIAMAGHAGAEVVMGVRGMAEELPKGFKSMDYRNLSSGVLGTVKGATTFLPMFLPQTEQAVNWIQLGTMVGKTVLDSSIGRSSAQSAETSNG